MTFTEAAVEILRLVGRPLHYKKITELAIERNLLSHVGKAPELTMSSRLAMMVKKDRGDEPIVKVKPGVFALREFTPEMLALADSGDEIDLSSLPPPGPRPELRGETEPVRGAEVTPPSSPLPRRPMPGAEVFPVEEDDDRPIFAGLDEGDEDDEESDERGDGRRRRRRRGKDEGDEAVAANEEAEGEERAVRGELHEREPRGRDRDRDRDRHRDRDRDRGHGPHGALRLPPVDLSREPGHDDLLGRDLADAVFSVLASGEAIPLSYAQIAEQLVRRGRLVGDASALAPTVAAAIRADGRRRDRPRFRYTGGRVALVDWWLPRDAVRHEREAQRFAERQREQVRRAFLRKLQELPTAGFVEIIATWLNAEGVSGLRAIRRPGSAPHEIHLAGVLRRGPEEVRLALVVLRDGRELGREKVIELRGSLHHYGKAAAAWIVSTGASSRGAREEAAVAGAAPIALFDGMALAEAMEARRVGLLPVVMTLSTIDIDLLEALRGAPEPMLRGGERADRRDQGSECEAEAAPAGASPAPQAGAEGAEAAGAEAAGAEAAGAEAAGAEAAELAVPAENGEAVGAPAERERGGRRRRRRRRGRGREQAGVAGAAMGSGKAEGEVADDDAEVAGEVAVADDEAEDGEVADDESEVSVEVAGADAVGAEVPAASESASESLLDDAHGAVGERAGEAGAQRRPAKLAAEESDGEEER
jgi:hypothetical protein